MDAISVYLLYLLSPVVIVSRSQLALRQPADYSGIAGGCYAAVFYVAAYI